MMTTCMYTIRINKTHHHAVYGVLCQSITISLSVCLSVCLSVPYSVKCRGIHTIWTHPLKITVIVAIYDDILQ